jgi:AraC family transcriptional regulator, regulatory protein of adaptative response / methylated-DNA-[protein]-cysteine methyltransferase
MNNYNIIAQAIEYLTLHQKDNITLEQLAKHIGLSPAHLQKTFTSWAGVSPKQFQRFLSIQYAKEQLKNNTTYHTSLLTGLTSGGRLHDLFVDIIAMTPGEYKNCGQGLIIEYSVNESNFGHYVVASTTKGICNVLFLDSVKDAHDALNKRFKNAKINHVYNPIHQPVIDFFDNKKSDKKIKLHLQGTNFQLQVWKALLTIPDGNITTYGTIAKSIGESSPLASRAVGTAIGDNPVGYIIPCHRVLKSTGQISGYRWGVVRKQAILSFEASHKKYD